MVQGTSVESNSAGRICDTLHLAELEEVVKLNQTNADAMRSAYGNTRQDWIGRSVFLMSKVWKTPDGRDALWVRVDPHK